MLGASATFELLLFEHTAATLSVVPYSTAIMSSVIAEENFEFIKTPSAGTPSPPANDCGVRTTKVQ